MSFEETADELYEDVASLNMDFKGLVAREQIVLEHVHLERRDIQEKGEFNLEGLFIRLEHAIDSIGATRLVIDSIESLVAGVTDAGVLRLEIKRLFRWLKDKQVTAIITGELVPGTYTRHGLEEYISDCIILLDNRVREQISTRRIRVIKYRGSKHATEYPFVIDKAASLGIPITSAGLDQPGTAKRVSTGFHPWTNVKAPATPRPFTYSPQALQAREKPASLRRLPSSAANVANGACSYPMKSLQGNSFKT